MTYSGVEQANSAREALGKALEALQEDPHIPPDVMSVASNIAGAVGALFEAEKASSEVDGKSCIKRAISTLSQTLALLQDVRAEHQGIEVATRTIAEAMSILYPLSIAKTRFPPPAQASPEQANLGLARTQYQTASQMPQQTQGVVSAHPSAPASQAPQTASSAAPAGTSAIPSAAPSGPVSQAPTSSSGMPSGAPRQGLSSRAPAVSHSQAAAGREELEANIGANTETNLFVGFSGEIAEGGVFVATYNVFPKGTPVHLLLTLPGGFEMNLLGQVRFVRDPMDFTSDSEPGIGVAFESLSSEHRALLLRFIQKRPPIFYDE